jgi:hypothetical protein
LARPRSSPGSSILPRFFVGTAAHDSEKPARSHFQHTVRYTEPCSHRSEGLAQFVVLERAG